MVVTFDNKERNAKLSLRQSEILAKLQAIVDDIACGCEKCAPYKTAPPNSPAHLLLRLQEVCSDVPPRIWTVHARVNTRVAVHRQPH